MKIGVLTFHRCINYGSYWQARCLVEALKARGHEAEILDFDSGRANFAEWKCALQPTLPTPSPRADRPLYRAKMCRFFEAFDELPLSPRFDLNEPKAMPQYDILVVGSDEVWNISHPWFGKNPLFFGGGARANRLISYAASFGNWNDARGLEGYWADLLRGFDALAVRDLNSQKIVADALGWTPPLTLDPCLQWPNFIAPQTEARRFEGEYLAVYGHNFSSQFAKQICNYARIRGLKTVSIGYRNPWVDENWLDAGPHEFALFMENARCVATDFFHGCVFALRNAKPFAAEVVGYRSIKISDLLASVGASEHLTGAQTLAEKFEALLGEPLAPTIGANIARLRADSGAYLEGALG